MITRTTFREIGNKLMKIVAINQITLDGVTQAPGRPDEDTRGGFQHGGWSVPYGDEVLGKFMGERMGQDGALLLGKRTYKDLYGFWPSQTDNPYTDVLNKITKYVASTTMREPLPWSNSVLLPGDAADAVAKMKRGGGSDLVILGSAKLVRSLMRRDLIDEYLLIINPVLLGSGHKLFPDEDRTVPLELVSATPTTTGVILAVYRPATPDKKKP
jgi:dihydrofolate reductase